MSIWHELMVPFTEKLPRRTAVLVKENPTTTAYYYPLDFGRIGYNLDIRTNSTYEEKPDFSFYLDEYGLGDLTNKPNATRLPFFYKSMVNAPNFVRRNIVFTNFGLDAEEQIASACDNGVTWSMGFKQRILHRKMNRRLFLVFAAEGGLSADVFTNTSRDNNDCCRNQFSITNASGKQLWAALPTSPRFGVYQTVDEYREAIFAGTLNGQVGNGRYLLLAVDIEFEPVKYSWEQQLTRFTIGLSSLGASEAAQNLLDDVETRTAQLWNQWLMRIPAPEFPHESVKRAYYKCWAVVKQNYYQHRTWGHIVLEALPVYKGVWTWGSSALPYNSLLDPDHPGEYARNALNLFCDSIRNDGFISHAIYIDEERPGERWAKGKGVIQTPHFPWVALTYYRHTGDIASLQKWYQAFNKYYVFICNSRDQAQENLHLWAALTSYDTGLDVAPMFTDITYYNEAYVYPAVFAAERCRYENAMGEIAQIIGRDHEAEVWFTEARKTMAAADMLLWDKDKHWYGVRHQDGTLETAVGIDGLFFLGYGLVSQQKAACMRNNVEKLIGRFGVFTIAPDESKYEPDYYWRGPAWPKSCAIGAQAVMHYYPDLQVQVLESITRWALAWPSIWECLHGDTGEVAGSDVGVLATPCVSSNVGAGELIGALRSLLCNKVGTNHV